MNIPNTAVDVTRFIPNYQGNALPKQTYYYNPATAELFSTRTGTPSRLYGTRKSGGIVYALTVANPSYTRRQVLVPASVLKTRITGTEPAQQQVEMELAPAAPTPAPQPARGWIIGSVREDGTVGISETPHLHTWEASVNTELERLAKKMPGKTFVKLRIEGYVTAGGINWS
jgi:hypothetical protein